ncbi:hypothetical protein KHC23_10650 [Ancylobacter dichloromethanicus]|uniref:hypothetical protein n=1 Tax=Ancylobacter dichloromethanicus TaxID=518825 RepID=UPI001BCE716D|nr:hypothetical protein [Ancylobacter dichloromethanicus]MBS7554110.1 hypothetical protein [Ancylobacter dichloromethanicus]
MNWHVMHAGSWPVRESQVSSAALASVSGAERLLASTVPSSDADCIATLQPRPSRDIPADAPQFRPRETPPLRALSPDGGRTPQPLDVV